jgi:hypothetical protein
MWYIEKDFVVKLGGTLFLHCQSLVDYKGDCLFTLRKNRGDKFLEIDLTVYNKHRHRQAVFVSGAVTEGAEYDFRIINEPAFYCIHDLNRRADLLRLKRVDIPEDRVSSDDNPIETRLWRNLPRSVDTQIEVDLDIYAPDGERLIATPDSTNCPGSTFMGVIMEDAGTGVAVG